MAENPKKQNENDTGAVTYKDLFLSTVEVAYFVDAKIEQRPGEHAHLYVKAVLDSGVAENEIHGISRDLCLQYRKGGRVQVLFYGVVDKLSVEEDGDGRTLILTAWDATWQMDLSPKKRIFQNPGMQVHQLIREVMAEYIGCDYKIHTADAAIGQLVVQYEETDWEFLKRFLSKYGDTLYPDTTYPDIRLEAGLDPHPESFCWDALPYELSQDLERFCAQKENGMGGMTVSQNAMFTVESYDIAPIGSQITYRGAPWFIASAERFMEGGILKNRYELRQRESLRVLPYFNRRITGISIDGVIAAVKRDRVQVNLEIEAGSGEKYWFPYSTVAASSDGSGWYCMPETGESVRVYCPTDDEKEAYVVTAIKSHEPDAGNPDDPMGNPDVRNIQTAQGNTVKFAQDGVTVAAGGGSGSVTLKKSGEFVLDARAGVTISAAAGLNISANNELTVKSQDSIRIVSGSGADVEIKKGKISFHGMRINEN